MIAGSHMLRSGSAECRTGERTSDIDATPRPITKPTGANTAVSTRVIIRADMR